MRIGRFLLFACSVLTIGAQAAAQKIETGEAGILRPGGVYMSLSIEDAAACARLCETDGICCEFNRSTQHVP